MAYGTENPQIENGRPPLNNNAILLDSLLTVKCKNNCFMYVYFTFTVSSGNKGKQNRCHLEMEDILLLTKLELFVQSLLWLLSIFLAAFEQHGLYRN